MSSRLTPLTAALIAAALAAGLRVVGAHPFAVFDAEIRSLLAGR